MGIKLAQLIRLVGGNSQAIFVAPEHVVAVAFVDEKSSKVHLDSGDHFLVVGPVNEVATKIRDS